MTTTITNKLSFKNMNFNWIRNINWGHIVFTILLIAGTLVLGYFIGGPQVYRNGNKIGELAFQWWMFAMMIFAIRCCLTSGLIKDDNMYLNRSCLALLFVLPIGFYFGQRGVETPDFRMEKYAKVETVEIKGYAGTSGNEVLVTSIGYVKLTEGVPVPDIGSIVPLLIGEKHGAKYALPQPKVEKETKE